jgi:uncharacterized protein (DUF2336 family)
VSAVQARDLMELAHGRHEGDRERLLLAVADLCDASPEAARPELQTLLDDVFMALVVEAERHIRRALAERLATATWAPPSLINVLALDDIDIARPIILSSPLLQDTDLIRLLVEATIEHQIEVARRPKLASKVVDAIVDGGEPAVMTALANNPTAQITDKAMARLVEAAKRVASLRSPLARHPKLNKILAEQLYAYVGEALKSAICERFQVDASAFDPEISAAVASASGANFVVARDGERQDMEERLIAKLESAGQLRPGYLVRALKEGKLSLFMSALSSLGGFSIVDLKRACNAPDPELLALACAAVSIDRSAFPDVLTMVRDLNDGKPAGDAAGGKRAAAAFNRTPEGAAKVFRERIGGVD